MDESKNKNILEELEILSSLIDDELKIANNKFPLFQSMHEAYGVMREELEECINEFKKVKFMILSNYWTYTMNDKFHMKNKRSIDKLLIELDSVILFNIYELIQLGAMVRKSKILNDNYKEISNENKWFI